ncbi:alpha/beta hydrolase family protein [Vibrio sp.]|uniref:alpha/beta hydrolase family protein n=1 Tax=Vibrio sp. TaxID=678 RepID=UPI003D14A206
MKYPPKIPVLPDDTFVQSDGEANILQGKWPERYYSEISRLELHYFKAQHPPRAQALVYVGGGYLQLVHDKEGIEVALWLASLGIDAYVVTHRLPGTTDNQGKIRCHDTVVDDGITCLNFLKQRSALPLIHVGLSSGGHTAGVMACQKEPLPAIGALIAYAPINANHRKYKAPEGKPDYPPAEKQAFYDSWPIGIEAEPHGIPQVPIFLAYALHDQVVPIDHALNMIKTAQATGQRVEAHIYPDAPHGFALRNKHGTHDQ